MLISQIIFNDADFKDLLNRFTNVFGETMTNNYSFRVMLVYLFRRANYGLQGIISENHYYPATKNSPTTQHIFSRIRDIFDTWNSDHHFETAFYEKTILKLSMEITGIMKNMMPLVQVIFITEQISDMLKTRLALERRFSSERVTLISHILTTENMTKLETVKDAVIVVPKSVVVAVNHLSQVAFSSTLVPVTIEITESDLNAIEEAISYYEEKIFNEFLI